MLPTILILECSLPSDKPEIDLLGIEEQWLPAGPGKGSRCSKQDISIMHFVIASIGNKTFLSATCWFFGRSFYDNLKYPIGFVATGWSGTTVEEWSSPDALKKCRIDGKHNPQLHPYVVTR